MKLRRLFLPVLLLITNFSTTWSIQHRVEGSLYGGLIGDALGKPTEFIRDVDLIFFKYPGGIKNFQDLEKFGLCWTNKRTGKLQAPYTDDTAMALLTLIVLKQSREKKWNLQQTMRELAMYYTEDPINDPAWHHRYRAPGNCCLKAMKELTRRYNDSRIFNKEGQRVFDYYAGGPDDMGCGSVMRAHPFGIVFADDPEKAATWAAQHSKITHGHPAAQAACAAMAIGIAYAIQGKDKDFIINQMIAWAKKYDSVESRFNPYSKKEEPSTWKKMEDAAREGKKLLCQEIANKDQSIFENNHLNFLFMKSKSTFKKYLGWAADDAIAATVYLFALTDTIAHAICLGVHTPGDSDSIASMAGALVGAHQGSQELYKYHDPSDYEGYDIIKNYAQECALIINPQQTLTYKLDS